MPRKKNPDAKDITMAARFSKTEADAIDTARGPVDRSVWLREAALAFLAADRPAPRLKPRPEPPPVKPASPGPKASRNCAHPDMRMTKGVCPDCGEWAVKT